MLCSHLLLLSYLLSLFIHFFVEIWFLWLWSTKPNATRSEEIVILWWISNIQKNYSLQNYLISRDPDSAVQTVNQIYSETWRNKKGKTKVRSLDKRRFFSIGHFIIKKVTTPKPEVFWGLDIISLAVSSIWKAGTNRMHNDIGDLPDHSWPFHWEVFLVIAVLVN